MCPGKQQKSEVRDKPQSASTEVVPAVNEVYQQACVAHADSGEDEKDDENEGTGGDGDIGPVAGQQPAHVGGADSGEESENDEDEAIELGRDDEKKGTGGDGDIGPDAEQQPAHVGGADSGEESENELSREKGESSEDDVKILDRDEGNVEATGEERKLELSEWRHSTPKRQRRHQYKYRKDSKGSHYDV